MSVTVTVTKKYLVFPTGSNAVAKRLCFHEKDALVLDLVCLLDNINPTFLAYVDVSRFMGRTLTLSVEPEMPIRFEEADEMNLPGLWQEPLRPRVHFSVRNGWNNDPNGLIYYGGKYHMFFQHNPCFFQWGNMHWGHAVSDDLLHWEEQDIALHPDEMGPMFSGSAIADTNNVTGFGKDGVPPMLLYYTAAGGYSLMSQGKKFVQCLAYSADGGVTFQKYDGNPIVEYMEPGNRDPKVVWVEELSAYIMALFLIDHRYLFLRSTDLIHWTKYQEITLQGDGECPDLYSLVHNGQKLWVLCGAMDVYIIGRFTEEGFIIESGETQLTYTDSKGSYAGQSFSGMPDGRAVRIWWDRTHVPGGRFTQQMGIPTEMSLSEVCNKLYLCAAPIREVETLRRGGETLKDLTLEAPLRLQTGYTPIDFTLRMPVQEASLSVDFFGRKLTFDMTGNQLSCPISAVKMPLSVEAKTLDVRIIVDRCTVEVFADGGKFCTTYILIGDENVPYITVSADHAVQIDRLSWYNLASVHGEDTDAASAEHK